MKKSVTRKDVDGKIVIEFEGFNPDLVEDAVDLLVAVDEYESDKASCGDCHGCDEFEDDIDLPFEDDMTEDELAEQVLFLADSNEKLFDRVNRLEITVKELARILAD